MENTVSHEYPLRSRQEKDKDQQKEKDKDKKKPKKARRSRTKSDDQPPSSSSESESDTESNNDDSSYSPSSDEEYSPVNDEYDLYPKIVIGRNKQHKRFYYDGDEEEEAYYEEDEANDEYEDEKENEDEEEDDAEEEDDSEDEEDNPQFSIQDMMKSQGLAEMYKISDPMIIFKLKRKQTLEEEEEEEEEKETIPSKKTCCSSKSKENMEESQDPENENATKSPTTRKRSGSMTLTEMKKKNPRFNQYSKDELTFYKSLPANEQLSIADTETTVHDIMAAEIKTPYRFRILSSNIDMAVKTLALRKVETLEAMQTMNGEYQKLKAYIESLCRLPMGKYAGLPIVNSTNTTQEQIGLFLKNTKQILDESVFGHKEAKDTIIRYLAQWIVNRNTKGCVIGIHGKPGVGKTTLIKDGLSKALQLPFASIPLAGANDGSMLEGHGYTYEGSHYGQIASALMEAKCMNPILYFDEVDKIPQRRSEEITGILIHLTDPMQNGAFTDRYFQEIPIDLSRCIIVFTYNDPELVSPILRDRMLQIEVDSYSSADKISIAKGYLIPSLYKQFQLNPSDITMTDDTIKQVMNLIKNEAGVRNLRRALEGIFSTINLGRLVPPNTLGCVPYTLPLTITPDMVKSIIEKLKLANKLESAIFSMYT